MKFELKHVRVGSREVLASVTNLIVPAGEIVSFNWEEGDALIAVFKLFFNDEAPESSLTFEIKDEEAHLTFNRWNEMMRALTVPLRIGNDSDGRNLSILVSNIRVGHTNMLSMQFMIDEVGG